MAIVLCVDYVTPFELFFTFLKRFLVSIIFSVNLNLFNDLHPEFYIVHVESEADIDFSVADVPTPPPPPQLPPSQPEVIIIDDDGE